MLEVHAGRQPATCSSQPTTRSKPPHQQLLFASEGKLFWERHNLPAEFASGDTGRSMVCALHSVRSAKDARHELQQLQDDLHQQYIRTKSDVAA
eukprot:SAG25_NODE_147_length_13803_cov_29.064361_17_plen_94_part_00